MNSSSSTPTRSSSGRLAKIKCSFCGNTFYEIPRDAVCRKCNRPANRPLSLPLRIAALLLPPIGLVYSLIIRSHSPIASNQGILFSLGGCALYGLADALIRFI